MPRHHRRQRGGRLPPDRRRRRRRPCRRATHPTRAGASPGSLTDCWLPPCSARSARTPMTQRCSTAAPTSPSGRRSASARSTAVRAHHRARAAPDRLPETGLAEGDLPGADRRTDPQPTRLRDTLRDTRRGVIYGPNRPSAGQEMALHRGRAPSDRLTANVEGLVRDNRVEVRVLFGASVKGPANCGAFLVVGRSLRQRTRSRNASCASLVIQTSRSSPAANNRATSSPTVAGTTRRRRAADPLARRPRRSSQCAAFGSVLTREQAREQRVARRAPVPRTACRDPFRRECRAVRSSWSKRGGSHDLQGRRSRGCRGGID